MTEALPRPQSSARLQRRLSFSCVSLFFLCLLPSCIPLSHRWLGPFLIHHGPLLRSCPIFHLSLFFHPTVSLTGPFLVSPLTCLLHITTNQSLGPTYERVRVWFIFCDIIPSSIHFPAYALIHFSLQPNKIPCVCTPYFLYRFDS